MLRLILILGWTLALAAGACAERRVALVIGADRYEALRPLDNAVNDARAMEEALEDLGFEVFMEANRDLRRMRRALDDLREDGAGADVALFFFAGHGVEVSGVNRLLPVDADTATLARLEETSLPLEEVRAVIAEIAATGLIILDACRNDPVSGTGSETDRSAAAFWDGPEVRPGLGRMGRAENNLFAFAAAPGATAADGDGDNSPFTQSLTRHLGTAGLEIRSVMTLVQQDVYDRSRGLQLPYVESGLPRLFFAADATDELPERERLLLAMAEIDDEQRRDVEQIAADAGMPLAPLYGALLELDAGALNAEQRRDKLREAARSFQQFSQEMRTLASADPEVMRLRQDAEEQLSLGAGDAARALFAEAAEIDGASREQLRENWTERTLSQAATHYLSGGAARAELRYDLAIADYRRAAALYEEVNEADLSADGRLHWLLSLQIVGDIQVTLGSLPDAHETYAALEALAEASAGLEPGDPRWQRARSAANERLGAVLEAQGRLDEALRRYAATLAMAEQLAAADPDNPERQRDVAASHNRIGNVLVAQDNPAVALERYQAALAIMERLATAEPDNEDRSRGRAVARTKVGEIAAALGDAATALEHFQVSMALAEKLAASQPRNPDRQRDLSVARANVGDALMRLGDPVGALERYLDALAIAERVGRSDRQNANWQRDRAVAHQRIGKTLAALGDPDAAIGHYNASRLITEHLVRTDATNAVWLRDLSLINQDIGLVLLAQNRPAEALAHLTTSLDLIERARAGPGNAKWRIDLALAHEILGDVLNQQGDRGLALQHYQANLDLSEELSAAKPGDAGRQRGLSIAHNKLADLHVALNQPAEASRHYGRSLAISKAMAGIAPQDGAWQKALMSLHVKLAGLGEQRRMHLAEALAIAMNLHRTSQLGPNGAAIVGGIEAALAGD